MSWGTLSRYKVILRLPYQPNVLKWTIKVYFGGTPADYYGIQGFRDTYIVVDLNYSKTILEISLQEKSINGLRSWKHHNIFCNIFCLILPQESHQLITRRMFTLHFALFNKKESDQMFCPILFFSEKTFLVKFFYKAS